MRKKLVIAAMALMPFLCFRTADAAVIINFKQQGADVVASGVGSINDVEFTYLYNTNPPPFMRPGFSAIIFNNSYISVYTGLITGPSSFGNGNDGFSNPSVGGDNFGFSERNGTLFLPQGYNSGDPLSFAATFSGQTFDSLDLKRGTYTYLFGTDDLSNTVTLNIGVSPVPLPASAPLFGAALMAVGAAGYAARRRKAAA